MCEIYCSLHSAKYWQDVVNLSDGRDTSIQLIHSFIIHHSYMYSCFHFFINNLFIHLRLIYSFIHYSFTHSFIHSPTHHLSNHLLITHFLFIHSLIIPSSIYLFIHNSSYYLLTIVLSCLYNFIKDVFEEKIVKYGLNSNYNWIGTNFMSMRYIFMNWWQSVINCLNFND